MDVEDPFEAFWAVYPNKVEERGARRQFSRLVRSGEVSSGRLIAGAGAYARLVQGRSKAFIKSPTSWLAKGCWADVVSEAQPEAAEVIPVFEGPGDVWETVASAKGSNWATSYLAPCSWNSATRTLRPRTRTAAITLRTEVGTLLRHLSVSVSEPTLALGGAHVQ